MSIVARVAKKNLKATIFRLVLVATLTRTLSHAASFSTLTTSFSSGSFLMTSQVLARGKSSGLEDIAAYALEVRDREKEDYCLLPEYEEVGVSHLCLIYARDFRGQFSHRGILIKNSLICLSLSL